MSARSYTRYTRRPLTLALAAAMILPAVAVAQTTTTATAAQEEGQTTPATKTLNRVQVTGSRIKKVDVEGAARHLITRKTSRPLASTHPGSAST